MRICIKCGDEKVLTDFVKSSKHKNGYRNTCKLCKSKYSKRWRAKHPNSKEHTNGYMRIWNKSNRYKYINWLKLNSDYMKIYRLRNPDKIKALHHRYINKKLNNGGSFTAEEWSNLCALLDNRCACCAVKTKLTADHIIPISKGGKSDINNIQPLCKSCNSVKNNKHATDYRSAAYVTLCL